MTNHDDIQQLKLLSVFHYVVAGFFGLLALVPVIHLIIGFALINGDFKQGAGEPPPEIVGWLFVGFAGIVILLGLALAISVAVAGYKLSRHTGHLFCLVVAGIECLFFPFGTVLGVFTIVVLLRPSVKELFENSDPFRNDFVECTD